ncbi:hypothetical protein RZS08_27435, partial [Arthrospira platensis SPKY1]|nr:hypothetical protein [Arthrospira platensis SPKY1]
MLVLQGDGPLPLRGIGIDPALWAVLCGRTQPWPGCRLIAAADDTALPAAAREAVPVLAGLLARGEVHGLVVRGHGGSGRGDFAAALAHGLGLAALELPSPDILTNGGFMLGCR